MRGFKSNNNVVYSCKYHVVWCVKYRRKVLVDEVAQRLQEILRQMCEERQSEIFELEVMPDHLHLLVECDPHFGIHRLVKLCKGRSSYLLRKEFPHLTKRLPSLWTNAYFVSTVVGAPIAVTKQSIEEYIENQRNV